MSQEVFPLGWTPHHSSQLLVAVLSHIKEGQILKACFFKIHLNITSHRHLGFTGSRFPLIFPTKMFCQRVRSQ